MRNYQFSRSRKNIKTIKHCRIRKVWEVQIKCWHGSKGKQNSYLQSCRNHIYSKNPISTSILYKLKAFKATSPSFLFIILFPRTFIYSLTPVMDWITWHMCYFEGHIYFYGNQEFQWKHFSESKVVRVIAFLQLLTSAFFLLLLTWSTLRPLLPAAELDYFFPSRKVSSPGLCPQSTHYLSAWAMGSCCFICNIKCPFVKENGTLAVPGWQKYFLSQPLIKLSWIVTGKPPPIFFTTVQLKFQFVPHSSRCPKVQSGQGFPKSDWLPPCMQVRGQCQPTLPSLLSITCAKRLTTDSQNN